MEEVLWISSTQGDSKYHRFFNVRCVFGRKPLRYTLHGINLSCFKFRVNANLPSFQSNCADLNLCYRLCFIMYSYMFGYAMLRSISADSHAWWSRRDQRSLWQSPVKGSNSNLNGNDSDRGKGIQSSKVKESEIQKVSFEFALVRGPCQMCSSWGKHAPGPRRQSPSIGRGQSSNRWIEENWRPPPNQSAVKVKSCQSNLAADRCTARNRHSIGVGGGTLDRFHSIWSGQWASRMSWNEGSGSGEGNNRDGRGHFLH